MATKTRYRVTVTQKLNSDGKAGVWLSIIGFLLSGIFGAAFLDNVTHYGNNSFPALLFILLIGSTIAAIVGPLMVIFGREYTGYIEDIT